MRFKSFFVYNDITDNRSSTSGFALPSVLFLVTILSFLSLSIVSIQYFRQKVALYDIAKVKSHYAAKNGIAWILIKSDDVKQFHEYTDQSSSETELLPWGFYKLVTSKGRYRKATTEYSALIAERQMKGMNNALLFRSSEHQLIFSGNVQIIGDIEVGNQGVSVGTLPQHSSPRKIPVTGSIIRKGQAEPLFSFESILMQIQEFEYRISSIQHRNVSTNVEHTIQRNNIDVTLFASDLSREVFVEGDASIFGKFYCQGRPLRIIVNGDVTFGNMSLSGPVQIIASGSISVPSSASFENTILYSRKRIEVLPGAHINAQLISPTITIQHNSTLTYPSALFSFHTANDTTTTGRIIQLHNGSRVEGFVAMNENMKALNDPELIVIHPAATVAGYVYSDEEITLDGRVDGTVITKDFYFYQSPTKYFGWLKDGLIDRGGLPKSYLLPLGFKQGASEWDVLEWL